DPPGWMGRVLFRQSLAIYLRTDHGPHRGQATGKRMRLAGATWHFALGRGPVPKTDARLPDATFAQAEQASGPLSTAIEEVLERYYLVKLGSTQFFGRANHGLPLWDGLESLALTLPIIRWILRLHADTLTDDIATQVVSMVDDHFGFNPLLGSRRQRFA